MKKLKLLGIGPLDIILYDSRSLEMALGTLLLFFITVFPLICTPGPDILFTASQGLSKGRSAALKAVAGIRLGYTAHAV